MKRTVSYGFLALAGIIGLSGAAFTHTADSTKPAAATSATATDFTAGASVRDSKGVAVGKVDSVDTTKGSAIVDTGQSKIGVPISMFTKDSNGVMLKFTADQFNAAIAKAHARSAAAQAQAQGAAQPTQPAH